MEQDRRKQPRTTSDRRRETRQSAPAIGWIIAIVATVVVFGIVWVTLLG